MALRDMHGGNFIIRKGSQEAVMVDIGDNRLYIGGKSAMHSIDCFFLAMIMSQYGFKDYGSPGTIILFLTRFLSIRPSERMRWFVGRCACSCKFHVKKEIKDLFLSKGRNMF